MWHGTPCEKSSAGSGAVGVAAEGTSAWWTSRLIIAAAWSRLKSSSVFTVGSGRCGSAWCSGRFTIGGRVGGREVFLVRPVLDSRPGVMASSSRTRPMVGDSTATTISSIGSVVGDQGEPSRKGCTTAISVGETRGEAGMRSVTAP